MNKNSSLIHKLSGLGAASLLAISVLGPVFAGAGNILKSEKLISEKRAVTALLEDRIEAGRIELSENEVIFSRLQRSLQNDVVAKDLVESCKDAAVGFSALAIQQSCTASQSAIGGGLTQHTAQLRVSGPPKEILTALETISSETTLDLLHITAAPEAPESATLTLRFSDVSKTPTEPEEQP